MKRIAFRLFLAGAVLASQAAFAAEVSTTRSAGAHPVVYDDYPESEVVIAITDDIVLTITGEARTRFEWVENNSDFHDESEDSFWFAPARFNLGFRVDMPRDTAAVIEVQSAFDFGDDSSLESRAQESQHLRPGVIPGTLVFGPTADMLQADDARVGGSVLGPTSLYAGSHRSSSESDFGLYQGYIETANVGDSIFSLRFGRQELAYGTEFLLGNQDWYDGLSYDGIKGIFEFSDNARLDVFWMKLQENQIFGDASANDVNLYGAYFSTQSLGGSSIGMDAYLLGVDDNRDMLISLSTFADGSVSSDVVPSASEISFLDAYWAGVRFFRERETGWHWSAELVYLFGDMEASFTDMTGKTGTEVDIEAAAFEGFVGFTWDRRTRPSLHGGVTWASGSDFGDYDGGESATFFTPAGEIHPRLGLMDQVDASNVLAYTVGYAGSLDNHSWGADVWFFEFDEVDPLISTSLGFTPDDEIGQELDLWYNYQYSENLVAQFALGWFSAGDFIDHVVEASTDSRADDAWRAYANLLLRF